MIVRSYDFNMDLYLHDMRVLLTITLTLLQIVSKLRAENARLKRHNMDMLIELNDRYHQIQTAKEWRIYAERLEGIIEDESDYKLGVD